MSETIQREQRESPSGPDQSPAGVRSARWTRSHVIWILIILSLVPGGAVAVFREGWQQLPAGVRMSAYIISGILIVAACSLILTQGEKHASQRESDPPPSSEGS